MKNDELVNAGFSKSEADALLEILTASNNIKDKLQLANDKFYLLEQLFKDNGVTVVNTHRLNSPKSNEYWSLSYCEYNELMRICLVKIRQIDYNSDETIVTPILNCTDSEKLFCYDHISEFLQACKTALGL